MNRISTSLTAGMALFVLMASPSHAAMDAATETKLAEVLQGSQRSAENKARDSWRHPLETLKFFGVNQSMTVMEVWPEAGWYTEILAPLMRDTGTFIAADFDPAASAGAKRMAEAFKNKMDAEPAQYDQVKIGVLFPMTKQLSPAPAGSVDMVLTFRNIHNWMARDVQGDMFASFYTVLKPGGFLGVVEHRANADQPQDPKAANGYVREDFAIAAAEAAGFKLVAKSEINANPDDPKDHPNGVWSLPPSYRGGDADRAKFEAIGESDRFTLLFQKPTP